MAVVYAHAKPGYKYQLTFFGRKVKAVASKFEEGASLYKQCQHCVPRSWISNGYVEEVKEEKDGN